MTQAKLEKLEAVVSAKFSGHKVERLGDALILHLVPEEVVESLMLLRNDPDLDFKLMIDLTGVHYPEREKPLEVVYQLLSVYKNHRLRIKVALGEGEMMPSITRVWKCADWYEREAYEMFGILFRGHEDLRRLLTDYDFVGYPLRKDFPLNGMTEVRYDAEAGRIVQEPTDLAREDRETYGR
ncbi:MAG: NADH-quinone oxidoreductase subunit C [Magnetococcales bacterium]|nr:NADH-quinone oxidoreductase subunit C [Magnetococcales bacterium]